MALLALVLIYAAGAGVSAVIAGRAPFKPVSGDFMWPLVLLRKAFNKVTGVGPTDGSHGGTD